VNLKVLRRVALLLALVFDFQSFASGHAYAQKVETVPGQPVKTTVYLYDDGDRLKQEKVGSVKRRL
jgi:hypothetical protein